MQTNNPENDFMRLTLRTNWSEDIWRLVYNKQAKLQKEKLRPVTPAQAIEVLLKDAYLRKKGNVNG